MDIVRIECHHMRVNVVKFHLAVASFAACDIISVILERERTNFRNSSMELPRHKIDRRIKKGFKDLVMNTTSKYDGIRCKFGY